MQPEGLDLYVSGLGNHYQQNTMLSWGELAAYWASGKALILKVINGVVVTLEKGSENAPIWKISSPLF